MLFLFIFCTLWGAGINPIIGWLYATIPQAAQWRKVGRALAIASFCLAVLAAMRIDSLQHAIELSLVWQKPMLPRPFAAISPTLAKYGVLAVVTIATCIAALQVPLSWQSLAALDQDKDDICVVWLRSQYPTRELSVMSVGYYELKSYIKYSIRHWNIASNVHMRLLESTLFNGDLTRIRPDFAIANTNDERAFFASIGYEPVPESPTPFDQNHCVYHKTNAPSYAFSIPKSKLLALRNELPLQLTTPITTYKRYLDRIGLIVEGSADEPLVVTVQERAYPGWRVEVDGKGAQLESVGGQIGVVLPAGAGLHTVYFQYRPLLFIGSGILTLITWGVCILYLLRAERFIPQPVFRAFRRLEQQFQMVSARIHRMLFSPAFSIHDDSDT